MKTSFRLDDSERKAIKEAICHLEGKHILACIRGFFALGLHLETAGKRIDARKACSAALQAFELQAPLRERILSNLDGNEIVLARIFGAHRAFRSLLAPPCS